MNHETCAVLTGAFPLILIALVADRRVILHKLRRLRWYRGLFTTTIGASLIGLAYAVIGVQIEGFEAAAGAVLWSLFALSLLTFGISVLMSATTLEIEEDRAAEAEEANKSCSSSDRGGWLEWRSKLGRGNRHGQRHQATNCLPVTTSLWA